MIRDHGGRQLEYCNTFMPQETHEGLVAAVVNSICPLQFHLIVRRVLLRPGELIEPSCKPDCRLTCLQFYDGDTSSRVSIFSEVLRLVDPAVNVVACPLIALRGPQGGAFSRLVRITAGQPHVWGIIKLVFPNAVNESREEGRYGLVGKGFRHIGGSIRDVTIPDLHR